MNEKPIRIVVVDDQAVVRQGFVSLIRTVADMDVIAEGTNGQQAVDLFREHRPDVMLIDLRMPVMGGVEAIATIRREFPTARIIVLTTYDGDEDIYRSLQAGAQEFSALGLARAAYQAVTERGADQLRLRARSASPVAPVRSVGPHVLSRLQTLAR